MHAPRPLVDAMTPHDVATSLLHAMNPVLQSRH